jgi:hypothetical protein
MHGHVPQSLGRWKAALTALGGCAPLLAAMPVFAEDWHEPLHDNASRTTELELGLAGDGTGANSAFTNIEVPFGASDSIRAALAYTNFDDFTARSSSGQEVVVDTEPAKEIALSYRHGFDRLGLNVGVERWGNEDLLQIDDYSVGFDYTTENSDWSFDVIRRDSTVVLRFLPGGPRDADVDAWGVDAGFDYLTDPVDVYASLMYFNYGDDLDVGDVTARFGTFSPFAVSNALLERGALVGARHQFETWSVGMEAAWYRGSVAEIETRTLAALFDVAVSDRVDLSFEVGGVDGEDADPAAFGVVSLRCALGGND